MKKLVSCFILCATLLPNHLFACSSSNSGLLFIQKTITFDNIPIGYIADLAATNPNIDGVSFTSDTLTVNGITFSNMGDTSYFAKGETPGPDAEMVALDGIAIRKESDQFGGISAHDSDNHALQQRTSGEIRQSVLDYPGRLNTIGITFSNPITEFSMTFGGNQPTDTVEVYDTNDTLVTTIHRTDGISIDPDDQYNLARCIEYAIDRNTDNKISYLKVGNRHSHDAIWIDNLVYDKRQRWVLQLKTWIIEYWWLIFTIATFSFYAAHIMKRKDSQ